MDLNVVDNIGKGNYDSKAVQSRRVSPSSLPTFNASSMNLDEQVSQFDDMVFGDYQEPVMGDGNVFVPKTATQMLDIMEKNPITMENITGSRLPDAIKRSIISNPLIEQPTEDPRMNELTEKLAKGMQGIQASKKILNDLDKIDAEKKELNEERISRQKVHGNIDYEVIRSIIEEVIDEKFTKFAPMLTESRGTDCGALSVMNIKNNKFLFLDDNDNIFECQMVFKGKNKAKRKK